VGRGRSGRVARLGAGSLLLVLALSACSRADVEDKLRFGWPRGITEQAERVRVLWTWSTVAALIVGALVWALIFWTAIAYRRRAGGELPRQTKYNLPIEAIYTVVPFLIVAVLFYYTVVTQSYVTDLRTKPDTTVTVTAFKWNWQFNYNDRRDPRTDDLIYVVGSDSTIPVLVVPENKTVRVVVQSNDVIHSFWVPELLFKRDVFPAPEKNQNNQFQFKPTVRGAYVGHCAELCGTYHSQMNFEMRVVSDSDYQRYLNALSGFGNDDLDRQAKALTAIGQPPRATTTVPFDTDRTRRAPSQTGEAAGATGGATGATGAAGMSGAAGASGD
jgi:cytochrome c oxidase subunit II